MRSNTARCPSRWRSTRRSRSPRSTAAPTRRSSSTASSARSCASGSRPNERASTRDRRAPASDLDRAGGGRGRRRARRRAGGRGRRPLRRGSRGGEPPGPRGERRVSYPQDLRALVEGALERLRFSDSEPPAGLEEAMRYSLLAGGKRVRPVLALATARALGADPERFLAARSEEHTSELQS